MTVIDIRDGEPSRRALLRRAALVAGGGVLLAAGVASAAQSAAVVKQSQKAVAYQPTPKGNAHCNTCNQWQPPADCKSVVGPLSPTGWCDLYIPKW